MMGRIRRICSTITTVKHVLVILGAVFFMMLTIHVAEHMLNPAGVSLDSNLMAPDELVTTELLQKIAGSNWNLSLNNSTMIIYDSVFYQVNIVEELANCVIGTPFHSLPGYKNPCWISKVDSIEANNQSRGFPVNVRRKMNTLYDERMRQDGFWWRMRCFPYVMVIGVSKCGTTDIYSRIVMHPEIFAPVVKEVRFWNRQRIGRLRLSAHPDVKLSFTDFLDCFDMAANSIRNYKELADGKMFHPGITLEATPHYLWDYEGWEDIPGNRGLLEPRFILAHSLHTIRPDLKFLVILRNPVTRLYSQFHMLSRNKPSPKVFHYLVQKSLELWNACLGWNTVRGCAYNATLIPYEYSHPGGMTLRAGLYSVFLDDWLQIYPRDQFYIIKAETYYKDIPLTLQRVFTFLGLKSLSETELRSFEKGPIRNSYINGTQTFTDEPMLEETRHLLEDFYKPFNARLSMLLNDDQFLWD